MDFKFYFYKTSCDDAVVKARGLQNNVIKKNLTMDENRRALFDKENYNIQNEEMYNIHKLKNMI